jgi:hypothetical protein
MKTFLTLLLAGALVAPAAVAAPGFEGKVSFKITSGKNESLTMAYSIKPGLVRMDTKAGKDDSGAMIINAAKQEMIILMAEQRMYMVQPMPKPKTDDAKTPAPEGSFEKTGVTEKIAGYVAEKYLVKSKDFTGEVWLTDQLGAFLGLGEADGPGPGFGGGAKSPASGWEAALAGKDLFPLRVLSTSAKSKDAFRLEATSIEKQSIPDSDFAPPAGWQKFDMGAMMKGMVPGFGR